MRIGILSLNYSWQGEATAAATWTQELVKCGHDAELFTFSKSGVRLKRFRTDYPVTILKSKSDEAVKFIDSKDYIISFGTGTPGDDDIFEDPHFFIPLRKSCTPLIVYLPIHADLLFSTYGSSEEFLRLPTIVGIMLPRVSLVERYYNSGDKVRFFKDFPHEVIEHPFSLEGSSVECRDKNLFVSTTRIAPSKKTKQILAGIVYAKEHNLVDPSVTFELWGSTGESRYGFLVKREFEELFSSIYKGPYTHAMLDSVYGQARYSFDLTNFSHDGGTGQNTYRESVRRSTVPIVLPQWNVADSCLTTPSLSSEDIARTIAGAVELSEDKRVELLKRGREFIQATHDPKRQTDKLISWLRTLPS